MASSPTTPEDYLAHVPAERAEAMREIRELVNRNLPEGYEEVMNWGMITWQVPLAEYPDTYNKQPLALAALANQKNYMSLYLMPAYSDPEAKRLLDESGKKLKMGKSCINFKSLDELPLGAIGEIVARSDMQDYITHAKSVSRK